MLKLIKVNSKSQIWEYFKKSDIENETWVVAKSSERDDLAGHILADKGYFLDNSVQLKFSFYETLYKNVFPEFTILSRDFAEAFLKQKMQELKTELAIDIIDEASRLRSITYFAPLLLDPDLDKAKFQEWLSESDERVLRLKPDLLLNELFLSFFLNSNLICEDWLLAHLQNASFADLHLPVKRFYFDLSVDYSIVEASLLQKLSKNHDLCLFQIVHEFDIKYAHLLQGYDRFDSFENITKHSESSVRDTKSIELKKFSSAVSECRFAVGQIKKWSSSGLRLSEMAIVAPDISKYFDMLSWQLAAENIVIKQNKKTNYLEFQDIRELLSDLSFFKSEIEYSSVRDSLARFFSKERPGVFGKIEEKLNSQFLQSEQLLSLIQSLVPNFFKVHLEFSVEEILNIREKKLKAADFLKLTRLFWERSGLGERKEKIINSIYNSTSLAIELSFQEWIAQVEKTAGQSESNLGQQSPMGLSVGFLSNVSLYNLKNVVVIGLDESGFKSQFKESIPKDDIFKLGSELGVYLPHPDLNVRSFQLEELLSQVQATAILSYPYKSIDSSIQNPAPEWQNRAFQQKLIEKDMDVPGLVNWDLLVNDHNSNWLNARGQKFKLDIQKMDLKPEQTSRIAGFSLNDITLSPSSIQTFLDCRQKFYFQRVLKLKNIESEAFDVNAREKGSWYHAIFEKIIAQEDTYITPLVSLAFDEVLKKSLLERLQVDFTDVYPVGLSPATWLLVKKSYFENAVKFIEQEVNFKNQFPEIKNVKVEWAWEIFYNWQTHQFSRERTDSSVRISGVIDRILINQTTKQLWLVDYKSSLKNYSAFSAWLSKQEFQLLLYNLVVQNYSGEPWAGPVEYLNYWQLPDLKKKKGFSLADARFLEIGHTKKDQGSLEEKKKVEEDFLILFKDMVEQMKEGHFYPKPSDENICRHCDWRLACRAPHL